MTNADIEREEELRLAAHAAAVERLTAEGRYYEACLDFCHEGLQVHEIAGRDTPEGYVRFGLCSADVRVPIAALPEGLRPTEAGGDCGLYQMEPADWPAAMKAAMRPLAEHALAILRQGGSGC